MSRLMKTSAFVVALAGSVFAVSHASASTFSLICTLGASGPGGCPDANAPQAALVKDTINSNTYYGISTDGGANGHGAIFKLTYSAVTSSWSESLVYSFCSQMNCNDGEYPDNSLIIDTSGNLYGVSPLGGTNGVGVAFKVTPSGTWSLLYNFGATTTDAATPKSRLNYVGQSSGAAYNGTSPLYGTTLAGGAYFSVDRLGTVYKLTKSAANWSEAVLHSFCYSDPTCPDDDGEQPLYEGVVVDSSGNIFGTTQEGGTQAAGILYKIDASGNFSVLWDFCGDESPVNCTKGRGPMSGIVLDSSGAIYGTTYDGGNYTYAANGGGVLFKYSGGLYTALHKFCNIASGGSTTVCADGETPSYGNGPILDSSGNLFGTTQWGGTAVYEGTQGAGIIYEYSSTGTFTNLHLFCQSSGCSDGEYPLGGLVINANGSLFGTTYRGGSIGVGVAFKEVP